MVMGSSRVDWAVTSDAADPGGAVLGQANLSRADITEGDLTDAMLPDGSKWTLETDMVRFTDPAHSGFWRSPFSSAYEASEQDNGD